MSENKNRRRHKKADGKSFIILPIIFFAGTYLALYLALAPIFSTLFSAAGMLFSDGEKDYSTDYKNIFVPVSDDSDLSSDVQGDKQYIDIDKIEYPRYGNQFGELIIEDCEIESKLFFGDGDVALRNGVGVYSGSFIPGYGKTILVAGHNNTYFNGLKYAQEGQIVVIRTSYGNYEYKITDTAVKKANDRSAYDLNADYENLVMYTCYPFDELGLTSYRFFVYAEYVSSPIIQKNSAEGE